jgi:peptide methionine sulfoxide reductase MsrA
MLADSSKIEESSIDQSFLSEIRSSKQLRKHQKKRLQASGKYTKPIVTAIRPATTFWPAENYHQGFYQKNPRRYRRIQRVRKQLLAYQRIQRFLVSND